MLVHWSWNMCLIVNERNQWLCVSHTALHAYWPLALPSSTDHYCSYICYSVIQICSFKIWLLASAPCKAPVTTACYTRMSSWSPIAPCQIQSIISRFDAPVYWSACLSQKIVVWSSVSGLNLPSTDLIICIQTEYPVYDQSLYLISTCQ